jgi:hypothetical protein
MRPRHLLLCAVVLLAACGGGDGGGRTEVTVHGATDFTAPPCDGCRAGVLTGTVAIDGRPLADAAVQVTDAAGRGAQARSDAAGRYRIELGPLGGTLVLEARGEDAGRRVVLHALQGADETRYGRRAIHLTPLTTLVAAEVLGGDPQALVARGEVQPERITERALQAAETRLQALLQPLVDAAGVTGDVDLRSSEFATGSALAQALRVVRVQPAPAGGRITLVGAGGEAVFDALGTPATPLPPPAAAPAALAAWVARIAEVETAVDATLAAWTAQLAGGLPPATTLHAWLAPGFRHAGLDADAYVDTVLRRADAPADGGYSLAGARFSGTRVLALAGDGRALLRVQVTPRAPFEAFEQTAWWAPTGNGWRLAGDGLAAAVRLRHAAVLQAAPLTPAQVQALPGVVCAPASTALGGLRCSRADSGGRLQFGDVGEGAFGMLALFEPDAADTAGDSVLTRAELLGTPSAAIARQLLLEVDARAVDPRVAPIRVRGGPLPASGVVLLPPPLTLAGPAFEHWVTSSDRDTGWPALPWGWCADDADAASCAAAWRSFGPGDRLRFELLDGAGALLATLDAALPAEPPPSAWRIADAPRHFARLQPEAETDAPTAQRVAGYGRDTAATVLRWEAPPGGALELLRSWQRRDVASVELQHRRTPLAGTAGRIDTTFDARAGWRSTWWSARLVRTDADGVRFVHTVSPANPR